MARTKCTTALRPSPPFKRSRSMGDVKIASPSSSPPTPVRPVVAFLTPRATPGGLRVPGPSGWQLSPPPTCPEFGGRILTEYSARTLGPESVPYSGSEFEEEMGISCIEAGEGGPTLSAGAGRGGEEAGGGSSNIVTCQLA
ncbi:hypothetical protein LIER_33969 [Lithospermum erythrorhizon]|uniref:Uncharacterized protein n=1 Tax=Lithospermum erythrorhizon TaxID=34254 RepID=A0AAV3RY66_LITER